MRTSLGPYVNIVRLGVVASSSFGIILGSMLTFTTMRRRHNSEIFLNSSNTAHAEMEEESRAMPSNRASRRGIHKIPEDDVEL